MAHKRTAVGFHSIPATDIKPKRTKVHDEMKISNDDVFHNILYRLPAKTLMRFRCVSTRFSALISRFLNKLVSHTNIKPNRTKILKRTKMEISDVVLRNIFSRLPPNPLMRFRCVSMHWNSLISDPDFINSRSRPKILISGPNLYSHLQSLDNKPNSMFTLPFPIKNRRKRRSIIALGTFNGIVVLVRRNDRATNKFVLYNPLTGATNILPDPPYPCCNYPRIGEVYGFSYGDDLNIIIGNPECECRHNASFHHCDVFSFKTGLWTNPYTSLENKFFNTTVGVFLNGFLHWISTYSIKLKIVALNVKNMVASRIDVPVTRERYVSLSYGLGTLHGWLCLIEPICNGFDVWVMKEHGVSDSWSKEYSFTLDLEYEYYRLRTVCILEDGRIVVMDGPYRIIFCDLFKGSYNVFTNTDKMLMNGTGIEYVESLVSPFNFCNV